MTQQFWIDPYPAPEWKERIREINATLDELLADDLRKVLNQLGGHRGKTVIPSDRFEIIRKLGYVDEAGNLTPKFYEDWKNLVHGGSLVELESESDSQ